MLLLQKYILYNCMGMYVEHTYLRSRVVVNMDARTHIHVTSVDVLY